MPLVGLRSCENVGNVWSYQRNVFSHAKYDFKYFLDQTHLMLILIFCRQFMEDFLLGANGAPAQCNAAVERVNECALAFRRMAGKIARDPRRWLKHATTKSVPLLVRVFK